MLQQPCSTCFLHVYDVESGLWVHTTLGSGVSLRIRVAMNHILKQDGILGYIGTKSEFGLYLSELKNTHGTDFRHCWTSLPASTIMSMLGLCLNMPMSGRPELVFYGSPLTLMLAYLMDLRVSGPDGLYLDVLADIKGSIRNSGLFTIELSMLEQIGAVRESHVNAYELEEALSYLDGTKAPLPSVGVARQQETAMTATPRGEE